MFWNLLPCFNTSTATIHPPFAEALTEFAGIISRSNQLHVRSRSQALAVYANLPLAEKK